MDGLEYQLWDAIVEFNKSDDVDLRYGTGNITHKEVKELIKLNKECDGWWHFKEYPYELVFLNTKSWIKQFNEGGGLDYDF